MKYRCDNSTHTDYDNYGGRGITYAPHWRFYENFLLDMGPRPEGRTLDRIDFDGHYEPSNCRWATTKEQVWNRRNVLLLPFKGELLPMSVISQRLGFCRSWIDTRIRRRTIMEAVEPYLTQKEFLLWAKLLRKKYGIAKPIQED